jgi:hypothetical protein
VFEVGKELEGPDLAAGEVGTAVKGEGAFEEVAGVGGTAAYGGDAEHGVGGGVPAGINVWSCDGDGFGGESPGGVEVAAVPGHLREPHEIVGGTVPVAVGTVQGERVAEVVVCADQITGSPGHLTGGSQGAGPDGVRNTLGGHFAGRDRSRSPDPFQRRWCR